MSKKKQTIMKPARKVLKNGLRVVTVPMKGNPTVTVLVLVEAGSHYETAEQNGISHFLEHMCFKGTKNRPSPMMISTELDSLGAQSNAFTGYEFTGYYTKARAKHFPKLLDVIADLYLYPTIPKDELEREKGVIVEEINMYEDLPMQEVGRVLDSVMYGDQPAGRSILGTKENVRSLERDAFVEYRSKHYVPSGTVVVVAGDITSSEVSKSISKYFDTIPKKSKPKKPRVGEVQTSPQINVKYKKSSQTHFQIGFRTVPVTHRDVPTIEVLRTVLGQGMSSRLWRKLREEMGVCYYVRANTEYHSDHGKFVVSSGVDTERVDLVLQTILGEIRLLQQELVSPEELAKAKEYLLGNMTMNLEVSDELAEYYGVQEILHQPLLTPKEYAQKIRQVTPEQIKKVATKLFEDKKMNLAVIGPFKDASKFKKLFKI